MNWTSKAQFLAYFDISIQKCSQNSWEKPREICQYLHRDLNQVHIEFKSKSLLLESSLVSSDFHAIGCTVNTTGEGPSHTEAIAGHVPKITAGFSSHRIGSIQGVFVVSKLTLELGFLTKIAFSFINVPKTLHDRTHLPVVYDS